MKKMLTILGTVGLTATTGATVVACGQKTTDVSKLNDKLKSFIKTQMEIAKELGNATDPDKKVEIQEKMFKNLFDMYVFISKIYLETSYAFIVISNDPKNPTAEIKAVTDSEYKDSLRKVIIILEQFAQDPLPKHKEYVDTIKEYVTKLNEKLDSLDNKEKLDLTQQ